MENVQIRTRGLEELTTSSSTSLGVLPVFGVAVPLGTPLLSALERMSLGGIILDASGSVIGFNRFAESLLQTDIRANGRSAADYVRLGLKSLLRKGETRFSHNESSWVLAPRDGKRPLAVYSMATGGDKDPHSRTVVILIDLDDAPQPSPTTLQRLFGLTLSEAALAVHLARGATLTEIAEERGVTLATVRSQLASVFDKTQTSRQTHLVALLARVAVLP
jgi:DNA-binding CsgD family transcriptional regulator